MLKPSEVRRYVRDMFNAYDGGTCTYSLSYDPVGYSWCGPIYSNMSGRALQTLHRESESCPFCSHSHRDRRHRCANCGAPEGEMP